MTNNQLKQLFPIYKKYPDLAYLDSGATTLKPRVVLDKLMEYYTQYSANIHRGIYSMSDRASSEYEKARNLVGSFLNVDRNEVVFTGGTTDSINLVARSWGEENIKAGDEIAVSQMEHHSNLVPWQELAERKKARLKYIKINDQPASPAGRFLISNDQLKKVINKKTKLVAITQVSNVLGTINPIPEIVKEVKQINPAALVLVDGAQAAGHLEIDIQKLGCDFYAFSGHKVYGPTGVGVLWGRKEILGRMKPIKLGGGMIKEVTWEKTTYTEVPGKFEGGTPPIGEVIALGEAVKLVDEIGRIKIEIKEKALSRYLMEKLNQMEGLTVYGPKDLDKRTGVFSFSIRGIHPHDVAEILNRYQICVRSGHHCAMPLHSLLGVEGTTRVSLGIYNDEKDIEKLMEGLKEVERIFTHG